MPAKVCADLLITEFLADNSNGLADEDLQFSDWIEIHNNGPDPADLGGLFLTDDPALPARWEIPSFVLGAGEYTVIFASGKDRVGTELHTNFRLNRDGEYLALVDADGATVLHEYAPMFPPQDNDRSFGLVEPVAGAPQAAFGSPTPGAANDVSSAPGERVGFSPTSRAFSGSIQVSLTANSPTAQIRYTTNGTAPTASSALYASPITLNTSTRLRAQIFEPGRPPGPVASETYISADAGAMNATSNLPIVLLENFGGGKPNADTEAMIMIFDRDPETGLASMSGEPQMATRCRIRVRGSSTAGEAKYSMVWEAWDEFNADKDVTPLGMPEESDWILSGRYHWDQTLIHNEFMYSLSNQIGRYASRTRFVELYFNTGGGTFSSGDYFGVYSIQEKIKRDGDRVDVERLPDDDDTLPAISGGYVTKIDRADPGDVGFPAAAQTIRWVYPKEQEVTTAQRNYLQGYFNDFYAALQSPNFYEPDTGYEKYIDVDSWIDHHILNTIPKNSTPSA
ncbi:MAG: CotH kinase family protein [Verrucomicrobiales bacterium]